MVLEPATGANPSNKFEIVYITAYTAGALTATVARGQEGTSAQGHSNGVSWGVVPTALDFGSPLLPPTRAYLTTNQAGLLAGQWNKVLLDNVSSDPGNYFDETTNHQYVAPVTGNYDVRWRATLNGTLTNDQMSAIYKNGVVFSCGSEGTLFGSVGSDVVPLAQNDVLELWVYVSATASSVGVSSGASRTYLTINPLQN